MTEGDTWVLQTDTQSVSGSTSASLDYCTHSDTHTLTCTQTLSPSFTSTAMTLFQSTPILKLPFVLGNIHFKIININIITLQFPHAAKLVAFMCLSDVLTDSQLVC